MALEYPDLLPGVFAAGANNHEEIPDSDAATGRMAWDVGFPSETSQPLASGGVPPRRLDMNGFGNRISQHIFYQQSGALYAWDASLEYPVGAHVLGSDSKEYIAIAASGPDNAQGAVNPVADVNFTAWKSWQRSLVDIIYPVGSIYMSANSVSPATLFGGVWEAISGRFLLASGGAYATGSRGGNDTISLGVEQMPRHTHTASTASYLHSHDTTTSAQTITANTASGGGAHTHSASFPETTINTSQVAAHTHGRGDLNIKGTFDADDLSNDTSVPTTTGAFSSFKSTTRRDAQNGGHRGYGIEFNAANGWEGSLAKNGAHTHSVTIAKTTLSVPSGGAHVHSVSITVPSQTKTSTENTHNHTVTVLDAGGSAPVNIMPPYLAVNVWKRTA